jgi:subtilisin family serine protease
MRRSWVVGLVAGAVSVAAAVSPATAAAAADSIAGDYLVMLRPTVPAAATSAKQADRLGFEIDRVYRSAVHGYAGRMTRADARALLSDPSVLSVEPDLPVHIAGQVTPTGLDRASAPDQQGVLGPGSTVDGVDQRVDADIAVIDTGSGPHPDLNVVMRTDCTISAACTDGVGTDANGHGTHVAGTAAALDNGFGVVGVAPGARIWSVRVLGASGTGSLSGVVAGINWVTAHADVIDVANISISCRCVSPMLDAALNQSVAQGVTYAVAAGNDHENGSGWSISGTASVITTSALADFDGVSGGTGSPTCRSDIDDTLADFSNFGASVDLAAPGVCIRSTWLAGGYNTISGTSMASPHVAGAAALLASQPAYHGNPGAIQSALVAAGNTNWTDDSGDGVKEPLLDFGTFTPATLPGGPPVTLSVDDGWTAEGTGSQARLRLSRALAGGEVVTASVKSADATALAGADYTALPATTVRLVAGQSEATLPLPTLTDGKPEGHETFTLAVSKVVGAVLADSAATVTIYDPAGPLGLSVSNATVPEGGGSVSVTVSLDAPVPSGNQVTVKAASANSTATAGSDYVALPSQTLTFTAGEQTKTLSTTITDDGLREGNETFSINLTTPVGARIVDAAGSVAILDDDGSIGASVGNSRVLEGNVGTTALNFPVTLSAPPGAGQVVTVTVKTANSTALAGSDYTALPSTTLSFAAGEASKNVAVTVLGDTTVEPDEALKLSITATVGAVISDPDGFGTIANDDGGAVPGADPHWLSVSDGWLTEAPAGRSGTVTLSLSSAPLPGETVKVTVTSAAGTATSGADFVAVPATTVVFGVGETQRTVDIAALDDSLGEPTETFTLALSGAVGAIVVDSTASVSVVSDEGPLVASVDDPWLLEGDSGQQTATVTVRLSAAPAAGQTVSLKVATKAGTASAGSDYVTVPSTTLSFTAGQTARTVAVTVNGDLLREGSEAFTVTLATAVGLSIADTDGTVTLVDEEGPITAALVDTEGAEGNSGSTAGPLTVRLSDPPQAGQSLSIKIGTTTGGTATASVDYLARALAVVTFAAGETTKTLPVTVFGDVTGELDETVRLTASTPTGGLVIADSAANLTILNDD